MYPLKLLKLWLGIGVLLVLSIIFVSLDPQPPDMSAMNHGDKLAHLAAYFCLMLWFVQLFERRFHILLAVVFVALGVGLEFVQGMTGYRTFDPADMAANAIGVMLASVLGGSIAARGLRHFERVFFSIPAG